MRGKQKRLKNKHDKTRKKKYEEGKKNCAKEMNNYPTTVTQLNQINNHFI